MGLLQAVCFVFKGKSAGLSLADKENTCYKFKLTPGQVFISMGLTWLFTVLSAHLNSSLSSEQPSGLEQCVHSAYRWEASKV